MDRVVERRRVDDARIARIELHVTDADDGVAGAGPQMRIRGQYRIERRHPDQRPRRAGVVGLVESDPRLRIPRRLCLTAAHPRHAEHCRSGRDVDHARVAWLDHHRADSARRREIDRRRGDPRIDDRRLHARPVIAAVRRLVEARAGAGVVRRVGLASPDEDRVPRPIVRVERQAADAVRAESL